jgi:hypothetical protein
MSGSADHSAQKHAHEHTLPTGAGTRRPLTIVLGISTTILIVEVIGAFVSGSLALLADAGHMLTDVAGLSLTLFAAVLAGRPAPDTRTWGYQRAEVLAAAAQAAVLLAVGAFVLIEGIRRLIDHRRSKPGSWWFSGSSAFSATPSPSCCSRGSRTTVAADRTAATDRTGRVVAAGWSWEPLEPTAGPDSRCDSVPMPSVSSTRPPQRTADDARIPTGPPTADQEPRLDSGRSGRPQRTARLSQQLLHGEGAVDGFS